MEVEEETHIVEVEEKVEDKKEENKQEGSNKEDDVEVVTEEIEVDINENEELDYGDENNENEVWVLWITNLNIYVWNKTIVMFKCNKMGCIILLSSRKLT